MSTEASGVQVRTKAEVNAKYNASFASGAATVSPTSPPCQRASRAASALKREPVDEGNEKGVEREKFVGPEERSIRKRKDKGEVNGEVKVNGEVREEKGNIEAGSNVEVEGDNERTEVSGVQVRAKATWASGNSSTGTATASPKSPSGPGVSRVASASNWVPVEKRNCQMSR